MLMASLAGVTIIPMTPSTPDTSLGEGVLHSHRAAQVSSSLGAAPPQQSPSSPTDPGAHGQPWTQRLHVREHAQAGQTQEHM